LTPAGQFFQLQAQQLLDRLAEARAATARMAGGKSWFGIGFVPSALHGGFPTVIRRFRESQPRIELALTELTTVEQVEALKAGRIDVGFGRLRIEDERITGEVIREEPVVAALPSDHPLSARKRVTLADLEHEPLLLYPARPRPSYADQVLTMFQSRNLHPHVALEANQMQTAIGLVAAGIGYTLVPRGVQDMHRSGMVYRPLADEGVSSPIVMNLRSNDDSPLLAQFRAIVKAVRDERGEKPALTAGRRKRKADKA
jgi:DNA-binding transcriptional LysR family regulator